MDTAALREKALAAVAAMDPATLREQTLQMMRSMDPATLRENTKTLVGANYVRMTESRRVARVATWLYQQLLKYDDDLAAYFQRHSHWILTIIGLLFTSTLVVVTSNWFTRRRGLKEAGGLKAKLDEAQASYTKIARDLDLINSRELEKRKEEARKAGKQVRIWMDGAFDMMHYGHMNAFRLGRQQGTYLIVGVNSDVSITENKGQPVCNDEERLACVQGCKFVDEVVENVPYVMNPEYVNYIIEKYNLDYIVHGDDPCLTPDGKDVYEAAKRLGKYRTIPRTEGVSTTDIVGRMLLNTRSHHQERDKNVAPEDGRKRSESLTGVELMSRPVPEPAAQEPTSLEDPLHVRKSNFLTTSHILRQFSAGVLPPKPEDRVVYIAGDWDMFHAGHIKALEAARALGNYLIVGIHGDGIVNARFGSNLPIMNLHERVLSVLGAKHVDDVLIDAPFHITEDMISALKIKTVVLSEVEVVASHMPHASYSELSQLSNDTSSNLPQEDDPYVVPRKQGILKVITTPAKFKAMTVLDIVDRIVVQRDRFETKFQKKKKAEDEYYKERYGKKETGGEGKTA